MSAVPGYSGSVLDSASVSAGMILGWQTESAPSHHLCLGEKHCSTIKVFLNCHGIQLFFSKHNVQYGHRVELNIIIL